MKSLESRRGNALFLILIAVALFAALSYAVTQSGRGGSGGAAKEQSVLNAGQILSHAGMLEQTINRIKLINGCTSSRLSFDQTTVAGYTNAGSPADNSCHIFHTSGGGMAWQTAPAGARATAGEEYTFISRTVGGAGLNANPDLVMVLLVNRETCVALNNAVGQTNPGGNPPVNTDATIQPPLAKFTGTFGNANHIAGPQMGDRGCMQATSDGYYFYYPLIIDPLD